MLLSLLIVVGRVRGPNYKSVVIKDVVVGVGRVSGSSCGPVRGCTLQLCTETQVGHKCTDERSALLTDERTDGQSNQKRSFQAIKLSAFFSIFNFASFLI